MKSSHCSIICQTFAQIRIRLRCIDEQYAAVLVLAVVVSNLEAAQMAGSIIVYRNGFVVVHHERPRIPEIGLLLSNNSSRK